MLDPKTWRALGLAVFLSCLLAGWLLEPADPAQARERYRHAGRNLALTFLGVATRSLVAAAAAWLPPVQGAFAVLGLPTWARWGLGMAALDFTGFALHFLAHRVAWLWRFHRVHHSDSELDVTSTYRFHPVDVALHVVGQLAVVLLLGVPREAVGAYVVLITPLAFLQHAQLVWPSWLERGVGLFLITARAHRLHHSRVRAEADSNYSESLRLWDTLFRTYQAPPAGTIAVGVDEVPWEEEHTLAGMLEWRSSD